VVDQIDKLDKLFMVIIPRRDNRVALTLAREAIDTQLNKRVEHIHQRERSKKYLQAFDSLLISCVQGI
jgi:hypothetical protein